MPRRTSREPRAASRPQPHPDCGRLSFAENRAPACEKGLGEGTLRQENPDSCLRRGIRAAACGASADERFASIGPPPGGGCRPARRPDAALPRLERQTTAGCIPPPGSRHTPTHVRASPLRPNSPTTPGTIASETGQSHPRPRRPPLPRTVLPDFSSGNPSFCTPRRRIEPIYFGIRNFFIIFACRKSDTL